MDKRYFATKAEMRKHRRDEVIKRFASFEPLDSYSADEQPYYLGHGSNAYLFNINREKNQKYIISQYKIDRDELYVYPNNYNLLSVTNGNINRFYIRGSAITDCPICIRKTFAPTDNIAYLGDLLFTYEVMSVSEFAEEFIYTDYPIRYRQYKDLEEFVYWYRNVFKSGSRISFNRMYIAYNQYERKRKTARFVPADYYEIYNATETYLDFVGYGAVAQYHHGWEV